jgi:activator of 2-hydroxyglutaryl-CoA dehydratase
VVERLGKALGHEVRTCPEARYAGAIGAALSA